jgi:hypothetical protein
MCEKCYSKSLFGSVEFRTCFENCNCSCHIPPPSPTIKKERIADVIDLQAFKSARRMGDSVKQAISYARWKEPVPYEPMKKEG